MIFVDQTGRRWRRIKRSTFGIITLISLPVAALVSGVLLYHPQWGLLPLAQNRFQPQPQANVSSAPAQAAVAQTKPASKTTKVSRNTTSAIASSASTPAPTLASTVVPTQAAGDQPAPSPSPVPANFGNSDYGRSHQPTR